MQNLSKPSYSQDPEDFSAVIYCEPALLGGSPVWRFFCPYCAAWHSHGAGEGGRVAHCTDAGRKRGSPYVRGGYYLKLDPKYERAWSSRARRWHE